MENPRQIFILKTQLQVTRTLLYSPINNAHQILGQKEITEISLMKKFPVPLENSFASS